MALRHRTDSITRIESCLKTLIDEFDVSDEKLHQLKKLIADDCKKEIAVESSKRKRMLETFVSIVPDGAERGEYIVLDFGGKFFRVVYVKLNEKTKRHDKRNYSLCE
jgi:hexokinase